LAHTEKTLSEKIVYSGKIFTVVQKQVMLENGRMTQRDILKDLGARRVLPIDKDKNVYFVRQFRSPFEREILEIPAGKTDPGENPLAGAKRELKEETGLSAENYFDLGEFLPSVGYSGEKIRLFVATHLSAGENHPDSDEFLSVVKIPFDTAFDMVMGGRIADGKSAVAILKAKEIFKL
jgi:ADP-ribose pyrophosphatase